jgi:hypothetical protein
MINDKWGYPPLANFCWGFSNGVVSSPLDIITMGGLKNFSLPSHQHNSGGGYKIFFLGPWGLSRDSCLYREKKIWKCHIKVCNFGECGWGSRIRGSLYRMKILN